MIFLLKATIPSQYCALTNEVLCVDEVIQSNFSLALLSISTHEVTVCTHYHYRRTRGTRLCEEEGMCVYEGWYVGWYVGWALKKHGAGDQ